MKENDLLGQLMVVFIVNETIFMHDPVGLVRWTHTTFIEDKGPLSRNGPSTLDHKFFACDFPEASRSAAVSASIVVVDVLVIPWAEEDHILIWRVWLCEQPCIQPCIANATQNKISKFETNPIQVIKYQILKTQQDFFLLLKS